jgi:hypothetical protein
VIRQMVQMKNRVSGPLMETGSATTSSGCIRWVLRRTDVQRGDPNRDRLAVARKMVCYKLAVERRQQDFLRAKEFSRTAAV